MAELDKKTRYRIVRMMEEGRGDITKLCAKFGITERELGAIVREFDAKRERRTMVETDMRFHAGDSEFARRMGGRSF